MIFLTKYDGWQYEEEYRIVDHQKGAGLHAYPLELLKSVTFGMRMSEDDKKMILQWLKRRGRVVNIFQSTIHDREFKITPVETQ